MSPSTSSYTSNQPLRLVYFAWLFGAFWMNIAGGAALNRFARALNATDAAFGLLAAVPYLGAIVQVPVSYLVERTGRRKQWFLAGGLAGRAMWVLIAAVPWLLPERIWWQAFLIGYAAAVACANIDSPCWVSWMGDLLPQRIRGRFISARSRLGQYMTLLLPLAVGWLLDHAAPMGAAWVRLTASGLLALAGLVGMIDILMHLPVPDAVRPRKASAGPSFRSMMLQPLQDRNFWRFLAYNFVLIFAVGFLGQYLWLFCFDVLHLSTLKASLLLIVLPTIVSIFFSAIYGPLIDKLGHKPLIILGTILIIPGSIGWVWMREGHLMPAYLLVLITFAGWPAVEIGRFNVLLGLGDSGSSPNRRSGIAYVAIFSVVVAISGALSGCFGSALVRALGTAWRAHVLGVDLTYHGVMFILSTFLRGLAVLFLIRFQEPRAFATRDAIQYVASSTVTNLQLVVAVPFRFLRRIGATAFKIRPPW
jgi:Na+/melibiose symporter-like transporter